MKTLQRSGAAAAFYLAAAYILGIVVFLFVLDYPGITDPAQKLDVLIQYKGTTYLTNVLMYIVFGLFLIVLSLSLKSIMKEKSPVAARIASAVGIVWAGMLIASGMVANAGIAPTIAMHETDPAQAVGFWSVIETVSGGLGCMPGEIMGGTMTLVVGLAALCGGTFRKGFGWYGIVTGVVGIISIIPALNDLGAIFGMCQTVWFVWLGVVLLRKAKHEGGTSGVMDRGAGADDLRRHIHHHGGARLPQYPGRHAGRGVSFGGDYSQIMEMES